MLHHFTILLSKISQFSKFFSPSRLTIFELVFTTVTAMTFGVFFWGITFVHVLLTPLLQVVGLNYIFAGFWIISALFPAYIIRKPGAALLSSIFAAFIEGLLCKWGLMAVMWGLVQGLGVEVVCATLGLGYRRWSIKILCSAAILSGLFSYALDFFYYHYGPLPLSLKLMQISCIVLSSQIFGVSMTLFLTRRLLRAGLLNQFKIKYL